MLRRFPLLKKTSDNMCSMTWVNQGSTSRVYKRFRSALPCFALALALCAQAPLPAGAAEVSGVGSGAATVSGMGSGAVAVSGVERLSATQARQLDLVIRQEMKRQDLSGLAVGIVSGGELSYQQGFGFADLASLTQVTEASRFRWASLSKPLTAVLAVKLAAAGQLSLDAPIQRYLHEYRRGETLALTTAHLLSNQGGIPSYEDQIGWPGQIRPYLTSPAYRSGYSALEAATALRLGERFLSLPGTRYHSSTFGFILAGGVLEAASGQAYDHLAQSQVIEPLALTSLQADQPRLANRVTGYRRQLGLTTFSEQDDVRWKLPGGGFSSTIGDLARWMQALMAGPFLTASQRQLLWTERPTSSGTATGYGLGFSVAGKGRERRIGHGGSQSQARSLMSFYPQRSWGVVMLSNSEWADLEAIQARVEAVLIKRPE